MLKLQGEVSLDGTGWETGLRKIERATERTKERVGETVKGLAMSAFGIYGIEQAIQKTIEYGDKIANTARRVGVGVEALQEFSYAAKQNGADIDSLTSFIEKLNSARIDPKKFASFGKLGVSESELQSMNVEAMMMRISESVRNRSSQELTPLIKDVGGKGAGIMIPMLKDDLAGVRDEAVKLGLVMKLETVVQLKDLADRMQILSQTIIVGLAPAIVFLMNTALSWINKAKAAGSFWGDLLGDQGKGQSWDYKIRAWLDDMSEKAMARDGIKYQRSTAPGSETIVQAWAHAGAVSDRELNDLDEATRDRISKLMKLQKDIEAGNESPNFTSNIRSSHNRKEAKDATDSLIKVGNFLGSNNRDIITDISRQQLAVLKSIDHRLAGGSSMGGSDMGIPPV